MALNSFGFIFGILAALGALTCEFSGHVLANVIAEWAELGRPRTLICSVPLNGNVSDATIATCDWKRLVETTIGDFNISRFSTLDPKSKVGRDYAVNVRDSTICDLTIRNVSWSDLTIWECDVTSTKNSTALYQRKFQLMQEVRPTKPEILNKDTLKALVIKGEDDTLSFQEHFKNNTVDVKCCSHNGSPSPRLALYLGNKSISEVSFDTADYPQTICIIWETATLTRGDDGAELRCVQNHQTYNQLESDVQVVNVWYGPEILEFNFLAPNELVVLANPKPELYATLRETNANLTNAIVEFSVEMNVRRYNAWNVSWNNVSSAKLQHLSKMSNATVEIHIVNPYGHVVFDQETDDDLFPVPLEEKQKITTEAAAGDRATVTTVTTTIMPTTPAPASLIPSTQLPPTTTTTVSNQKTEVVLTEQPKTEGMSTPVIVIITLGVVSSVVFIAVVAGLLYRALRRRRAASNRDGETAASGSTFELATYATNYF